jgi:DNA-binding winged helix-turn-helix (wHTH) protein/TolB-like protein
MDMLAAPLIHVDLATERLWRDGVPVPVTRKVFRLLRTFVTRPGQLMTTEALLAEVWPNTHVAEGSVKDCVKQLRALLGDDVANPRFIETIRGRGYVFRGGIELLDEGQVPPGCPEVSPAEADASPALVPAPRTGRGRGAAAALWVATVVILLLVAVAGLRVGNVGPEAEAGAHEVAPAPDRSTMPVVAIMPFVPLSEGEQVQLLAGAFTTGVASALSRAHDLIVVRGPVADEHRKAAQDGSGNSITHVLSGAVQLEGEAVRLTAMLEDARPAATSGRTSTICNWARCWRCRTGSRSACSAPCAFISSRESAPASPPATPRASRRGCSRTRPMASTSSSTGPRTGARGIYGTGCGARSGLCDAGGGACAHALGGGQVGVVEQPYGVAADGARACRTHDRDQPRRAAWSPGAGNDPVREGPPRRGDRPPHDSDRACAQ